MGFLISKSKKVTSVAKLSVKNASEIVDTDFKLYKPINEFEWKDATKKERKKVAIEAYKKFAF